jgi:hypothetical protein
VFLTLIILVGILSENEIGEALEIEKNLCLGDGAGSLLKMIMWAEFFLKKNTTKRMTICAWGMAREVC